MNKKEIAQALAILKATYPNSKIENAEATVMAWEMVLGSYSTASVMKAIRLHMSTSKFFPTPADIREKMVRAEIVYSSSEIGQDHLLEGNQTKAIPASSQVWTEERLAQLCRELGCPEEWC